MSTMIRHDGPITDLTDYQAYMALGWGNTTPGAPDDDTLESRMARMNADVARAEAALDAARKRAAEAREQRDAYAAQVAAITARVAGKGGV